MTLAPRSSFFLLIAALAACLGLPGCERYRSLDDIEEASDGDENGPAAGGLPGDETLESGFERVRRIFLHSEAAPIIADHRIALERRGEHDRLLKLSIGSCYSFVAFGAGDRFDADLILADPNGQTVASDLSPDPFPVIASYCPAEAGFYALRVRAARGSGDLIYGAYELVGPSAQAERRLAILRDEYLREPRALGPVNRVGVPVGGIHEVPIAMLPGRCYGVVLVADFEARDIDLVLSGGDGEPIARDLGTDAEPVIAEVCPTSARAHRMEIRGYDGGGGVWWQLFEVTRVREP